MYRYINNLVKNLEHATSKAADTMVLGRLHLKISLEVELFYLFYASFIPENSW